MGRSTRTALLTPSKFLALWPVLPGICNKQAAAIKSFCDRQDRDISIALAWGIMAFNYVTHPVLEQSFIELLCVLLNLAWRKGMFFGFKPTNTVDHGVYILAIEKDPGIR